MMIRSDRNPIIARELIPSIPPGLVDVSSVFNPGAARFGEKIVLLLRVQNRGRESFILKAESVDGVDFRIAGEPVRFAGIEKVLGTIYHCYDPRITRLGDDFYVMFAMDMEGGCGLGLARTHDFESLEFMGIVSKSDTRNGVLFSRKIKGRYLRLERPNEVRLTSGVTTGSTIVLAESKDLLAWRSLAGIAEGRPHYWDEMIGPGPPPIRTRAGWLVIYHGVAMHLNAQIYQAGVMLLDLENPEKVIARGRYNILEPRELYETVGQVPNVVFPSGAVPEEVDSEGFAPEASRLLVYYGAADTCVGLAFATVGDLIAAAGVE